MEYLVRILTKCQGIGIWEMFLRKLEVVNRRLARHQIKKKIRKLKQVIELTIFRREKHIYDQYTTLLQENIE